jgi:DNA-binding NarL/FixJ family response regulator
MLVDEHEVVRIGVRSLIRASPDWIVAAEAARSEQALKLAAEVRPDIVVLGISLPGVSGPDLMIELKKLLPDVEFLVLTMHESEQVISSAVRSGARGYILKSDDCAKIIEALTALSHHQTYFSSIVSEILLQVYLDTYPRQEGDQLSQRERQIVKLVAEGNSTKRIAQILNIGVKTVDTHRTTAMRKTGAKSSADLTRYAVRNELVQL